jgi:hypothetical protein
MDHTSIYTVFKDLSLYGCPLFLCTEHVHKIMCVFKKHPLYYEKLRTEYNKLTRKNENVAHYHLSSYYKNQAEFINPNSVSGIERKFSIWSSGLYS